MAEHEKNEQVAQTAAKKEKKTEKKSKPGFFARVSRWLREMRVELKKVQWPTGKQTLNNTLIVIGCVVFVGIFIWIFDFLASSIIQALISFVKG